MDGLFVFNLLLILASLFITSTVGILVMRRRRVPGALPFGIMVWCEVVWIFAFALEVFVSDLNAKIWIDQFQYIPGLLLPVMAVWFLMEFSGQRGRIFRGVLFLSIATSAFLAIMVMSNGLSGMIHPGAYLVTENRVTMLVYAFGLWDYAAAVFQYLVFLGWVIYLLLYARRQPAFFRPQIIIIALGFLVPLLAFLFYFLGIQIGFQRDPSPYAFTLANLIVAWGLLRHRLFDLRPIAAETLLDRMSDAVLTADWIGRLVDLNPAAKRLGWLTQMVIGSPVSGFFAVCTGFPAKLDTPNQGLFECEFQSEGSGHIYEVTLTPLLDRRAIFSGHLIVLHEITQRKQIELELRRTQAELEQRVSERTAELTQAVGLLRENEEKFRALVEQSSEGFVLINPEGRIVEWNNASEKLTRLTRREALDAYLWDILGLSIPDDLRSSERLRVMTEQALRGEATDLLDREFEIDFRGVENEKGVMLLSIFPVQVGGRTWLGSVSRDITERKRAEENLRNNVEKLNSLRSIDQAILTRMEIDLTLRLIAQQAQRELKADAAVIVLYDPEANKISHRIVQGEHRCGNSAEVGCLAEEVIRSRQTMHYAPCTVPCDESGKFGSCTAIPVKVDGQVRGVLEVFYVSEVNASDHDRGFLEALASQAAIAIGQADLFRLLEQSNKELKDAYEATITSWARALEIRDKETRGHTKRVTALSLELARRLNFPSARSDDFRYGVILHDIGKMVVPDSILNKPGKLTDEEWVIMRNHVEYGHEILATNPYLSRALEVVDSHHEWWNGNGYPQRLRETEIPLGARIFAVVDVWDALIEKRVYREAWNPQQVMNYIRDLSGVQFDPAVVQAFLELINKAA